MSELPAHRVRRSLLFVPGAEQRKLERATGAGADTLLLDLEDSVAPAQKEVARANVAAFLRRADFGECEAAVRVNAPGTPYFGDDVAAVVEAGGGCLLIPKCEGVHTLAAVAAVASAATRLLALIESPRGVASVAAIATGAGVEALCFGHADFTLEMGLAEADASRGVAYHARCNVAIAAKAAGVAPIDCVYMAVRDEEGFRRDAELGRDLGYEGKLCIHPRQVEIANEVYTPTAAQIDYATRVVEAWRQAEAESRGVFTLDDRMIDAPVVALQRKVLQRARRAGAVR